MDAPLRPLHLHPSSSSSSSSLCGGREKQNKEKPLSTLIVHIDEFLFLPLDSSSSAYKEEEEEEEEEPPTINRLEPHESGRPKSIN